MSSFPADLPLALDRRVRVSAGGRCLIGGDPVRALRLSSRGAEVLSGLLRAGAADSAAAQRLARMLVDGGFAHPQPPRAAVTDVTVAVPVRDRADSLERCLMAAVGDRLPLLVVDDGSRDAAAVEAVCARHGARLVRREVPGGPALARNVALRQITTTFVAFLDSDCVPQPGWLDALLGHFADPLVAAAAPRIRGVAGGAGPTGRFAVNRLPLDLGLWPARVIPGGRTAYVPTAALLIRRLSLDEGFDPALRYGEDVDIIWRLHDAGWRIRYEPRAVVDHVEPRRLRDLLARRFHYGTSAAPLSQRHPRRLSPFVAHPATVAVAGVSLTGRPKLTATAVAAHGVSLTWRLRPAGVPAPLAAAYSVRAAAHTLIAAGRTATMLAPAALAAGLVHRRTRRAAGMLLFLPPLCAWFGSPSTLDPVRWSVLSIADDVAYGAGVWAGALRGRTPAPLIPSCTTRTESK